MSGSEYTEDLAVLVGQVSVLETKDTANIIGLMATILQVIHNDTNTSRYNFGAFLQDEVVGILEIQGREAYHRITEGKFRNHWARNRMFEAVDLALTELRKIISDAFITTTTSPETVHVAQQAMLVYQQLPSYKNHPFCKNLPGDDDDEVASSDTEEDTRDLVAAKGPGCDGEESKEGIIY